MVRPQSNTFGRNGEVGQKGGSGSELEIANVRRWEILDAVSIYIKSPNYLAGEELVDEYEELFGRVRTIRC